VVAEDNIREGVRQVLLPLWSTWYFFTLYAGASRGGAGYRAKTVAAERVPDMAPMDRYLLARTGELVAAATAALDAYEIAAACALVREHLDVLTNWYVRTQRDRFWVEDDDAFDTLYTALEVLTRLMAPLAPMVAEEIWRGLTGGRSVHLTDWPTPDGALADDPALTAAMDQARAVVSTTLGLRKAHQVRVRQPLRTLTVAVTDPAATAPYVGLVATELNVKDVALVADDEASAERFGITRRLAVNARAAGPRLGRAVQGVIGAARAGAWREDATGVVVVEVDGADVPLESGEYELTTVVTAGEAGADVAAAVLPGGAGFVVLDLALDDELRAEGYARDVVRVVQDARKAAGLQVSDRITLTVAVPAAQVAAVEAHAAMVARETLATAVSVVVGTGAEPVASVQRAGSGE